MIDSQDQGYVKTFSNNALLYILKIFGVLFSITRLSYFISHESMCKRLMKNTFCLLSTSWSELSL